MSENIVCLVDRAKACLANGQLDEARALYTRLSHLDNHNEEIWLMLAVLRGESGELDDALHCVEQAVELDAGYVEAHLTRARLLQKLDRPEDALQSALKAVEIDGDYAEAWLFLAGLAGQLNRYADAEEWARRAISLLPDNAEAYINLANAHYQQGNAVDAETAYRQALELQPDSIQAQSGLPRAVAAQQRFNEAIELLGPLLQYAPDDNEALDCLGVCYMNTAREDEAAELFERIIEACPQYQPAWLHLASLYEQRGDFLKAIDCLKRARETALDPLAVTSQLAKLYHDYGMLHLAIECCDQALELSPNNFEARFFKALCLVDSTRYEVALAELQELENEAPGDPRVLGAKAGVFEKQGDYESAYRLIQPFIELDEVPDEVVYVFARLCHRFDECDKVITLMNDILARPGLDRETRCSFLFTLSKLYDRLTDYDAAFSCIKQANGLKSLRYDHEHFIRFVDRLLDTRITHLAKGGVSPDIRQHPVVPVFIVGMPRSGTSLVEQILASHPGVHALGERHEIAAIATKLPSLFDAGATYPECLALLSQEQIHQISKKYLESIGASMLEASVITDKMPGNFQHLVLIRMLFPTARIIHCVRDPMDTCFSCYSMEFIGYHDYAYDLRNLGRYYREYQRLMQHYRDEVNLPMLEVKYEELVNDAERVTRGLVEYCGLDWDDRCLRYYESDRVVRTASYEQVREPIYTRSVNRWKHYEKHLEPLIKALTD